MWSNRPFSSFEQHKRRCLWLINEVFLCKDITCNFAIACKGIMIVYTSNYIFSKPVSQFTYIMTVICTNNTKQIECIPKSFKIENQWCIDVFSIIIIQNLHDSNKNIH